MCWIWSETVDMACLGMPPIYSPSRFLWEGVYVSHLGENVTDDVEASPTRHRTNLTGI